MGDESGDVTSLLIRVKEGDEGARAQLVPLVYGELRRLAGHFLRRERAGHTLQPTALVHEAYMALVRQDVANLQNRANFMAISAQLMRRILLQYARRRAAKRTNPDPDAASRAVTPHISEEILAVDQALERLAQIDPQRARLIELRYFGGLSVEETAEALQLSPRTVNRDWALAKSYLHVELSGVRLE